MRGSIKRRDRAEIADAGAAIDAGVRVENFPPDAGARHANRVVMARLGGKVIDHDDRRIAIFAKAREGEDGLIAIIPDDPRETAGLAIAGMQRRPFPVRPV